jgi:hypothetical protein
MITFGFAPFLFRHGQPLERRRTFPVQRSHAPAVHPVFGIAAVDARSLFHVDARDRSAPGGSPPVRAAKTGLHICKRRLQNDTPEVLRKYAKQLGIDSHGWTILRGVKRTSGR